MCCWFGAGYSVDADVTAVNLTAVAAPAPVSSSPAAAAKGGSSTNVGAIVGGVIGGVCGVGLIALLITWLHFRNQRRRDLVSLLQPLRRMPLLPSWHVTEWEVCDMRADGQGGITEPRVS